MHRGVDGGVECEAIFPVTTRAPRERDAAHRRDDLRRLAFIRGRRAVGNRWRRAARNPGLAKYARQVRRPELEHFRARRSRIVRRTCGLSRRRIEHDRAMDRAHANRRFAGNEPGRTAARTPGIRQVARSQAHFHALQILRWRMRRFGHLRIARAQGIDDVEEQRRSRFDTDERRIAAAVEIADPDDQHIRPDDARTPCIAKTP